ncbi:gluconate 2-dehydrogenase subunit 3 family protein [Solimonas soli]|uniref:gluconate 2-dehydrogenase subunit 3 family protein n=1 Tax=Solimonas soli TaxID=413479 RepID=UPI0004B41E86|nr:gluconate 2-dehydrogenase subunit 3 family protein [Solimonas soli]
MQDASRRQFLKTAGAAAVAGAALPAASAPLPAPAAKAGTGARDAYVFFNPQEARFIEAAVARLIPLDDIGPGAREVGVQNYLDKQLGGAWGAGERLYRSGPWKEGMPSQGYQLPYTPAELFRTALRAVDDDVQKQKGKRFDALPPAEQDAYLTLLQKGGKDLGGVPSAVFFESLLGMTIEGYFSDPVYGGNRDMLAWKMIGFPGAYAGYYHLVDQHGIKFEREPMSLAEGVRGDVHVDPDIPADGVYHDGHGAAPTGGDHDAPRGGGRS